MLKMKMASAGTPYPPLTHSLQFCLPLTLSYLPESHSLTTRNIHTVYTHIYTFIYCTHIPEPHSKLVHRYTHMYTYINEAVDSRVCVLVHTIARLCEHP